MTSVNLRLFGHPIVELDEQIVVFETRKALAILVYLALSPQPVSRELLASLFWPEFSQSQALSNLRRNMNSLANSLKGMVLASDRWSVWFKDQVIISTDIQDFRRKVHAIQDHGHGRIETCEKCLLSLEAAIQAYRGEFLEGLNLRDCPEFDEWQYQQRQVLQQELRQALESHITQCVARRRWERAILSAQRLVSLDCLDEASHRTMMWLYAQDNQRMAALHQYKECLQILKKELDQDPEPETIELYQNIRDGNPIEYTEMDALLTRSSTSNKLVKPIPSSKQQDSQLIDTVLRTKLFIPPIRKDAVKRPCLLAKINQGVQGALTVVSAPAGFGKTTLLASWAAQFSSPVGWLSLDTDDNDLIRFMTYLIMGLKTIHPELGELSLEMLASPQPPPSQTILTPLLNEISSLDTRFVLVLDDYHMITADPVQKVLSFLIDHICPNLHLVIATRSDPLLPLARLRVRSQLVELRAEDLRFSLEEAADFLNVDMGLSLSSQDVALIGERTEGWIAGLQMAALSMSRRQDKAAFIQTFSGSHRYILDYLVGEVLSQQPEPIQNFLLETSILERLTGALCNTLTGNKNGQEMLEELEALNLFLMPLDDEHHWYRYHQLFAGLLRSRFQFSQPDLFTTFHQRASVWFEQNGYLNYAIYHSMETNDDVRSANLVEKVIRNQLNFNGTEILAWMNQIPDELVYEKPFLCLAKAVDCNNKFQHDATIEWLHIAEEHAFCGKTTEESNIILGLIDTLKAVMATIRGDLPEAKEKALQAIQYLPDQYLRFDALGILGETYYLSGNIQEAIDQWDEVKKISEAAKNTYGIIEALNSIVRAMLQLGKLKDEERICRTIFRLAQDKGIQKSVVALARLWHSDLLREWNELEQAEYEVSEGLAFFSEDVRPDNLCLGQIFKAYISLASGNLSESHEAGQRAEQICRQIHIYPDISVMAHICWLRLCLANGDIDGASKILQECLADQLSKHDLLKEWILISKARLRLVQGQAEEANEILTELAKNVESSCRTRDWIEILILQAVALSFQGQRRDAIDVITKSLQAAEPEGYIRLYVSEGDPMRLLLEDSQSSIESGSIQVQNCNRVVQYIQKLLASFSPPLALGSKNVFRVSQFSLMDTLSNRELEVLQCLSAGFSNQQIAEKLYITNSTVKSHLHHIFSKIGVENRTQAIIRAKELNLI